MRNALAIAAAATIVVIAWADPQDPVLAVIELPEKAEALREAGMAAPDVKEALRVTQTRQVPVDHTVAMLDEVAAAAREHGPVDHFGAVLRAQIDEGLRGSALTASLVQLHAEPEQGARVQRTAARGRPSARLRGVAQKPEAAPPAQVPTEPSSGAPEPLEDPAPSAHIPPEEAPQAAAPEPSTPIEPAALEAPVELAAPEPVAPAATEGASEPVAPAAITAPPGDEPEPTPEGALP